MKRNSEILFAIFAWSLLILRFGYRYGTGDQVELLPYTLFLHDTSLYASDFFIQHLHASVPNERTVMANLLLPFVNHLELFCFLGQMLCTLVLVTGLVKLAGRFIKNQYLSWLAVLIALIPLNDFGLGNVELYSECLQVSGLATAIVVWAIHLFLNKRYTGASALMALATFIQLLDGLDVMMVLTLILFISLLRGQVTLKTFATFFGLYALTAGVYLILIFVQKSAPVAVEQSVVFNILFLFRHPHHFIIASFSKIKVLVFVVLSALALLYYYRRNQTVWQFVAIGLAGVLIYAFMVDFTHTIFIANFQFYKVTAWLKFLGVVALVGLLEKNLKLSNVTIGHKPLIASMFVSVLACWLVILQFCNYLPYTVPFQLFGLKESDPIISICQQIEQATPANAVFVQPFDNTELKFYGRRSSYVEFKANVRNKAFIQQWVDRIEQVYDVSPNSPQKGFALQQAADNYYYHLPLAQLQKLKAEGVTHLLTKKEFVPATGTLILSNNTYAVYQL